MALCGDSLCFTNSEDGTVWRIIARNVRTLLARDQAEPFGIAADPATGEVFWANRASGEIVKLVP